MQSTTVGPSEELPPSTISRRVVGRLNIDYLPWDDPILQERPRLMLIGTGAVSKDVSNIGDGCSLLFSVVYLGGRGSNSVHIGPRREAESPKRRATV